MNCASTQSKLAQLRAKTDQQLSQIIERGLQSALKLLELAEPEHARAEKAYAEGVKLLPMVDDPQERRRLNHMLVQVRESLERLSRSGEFRASAAAPDKHLLHGELARLAQ
jgi:hypothetical protein